MGDPPKVDHFLYISTCFRVAIFLEIAFRRVILKTARTIVFNFCTLNVRQIMNILAYRVSRGKEKQGVKENKRFFARDNYQMNLNSEHITR